MKSVGTGIHTKYYNVRMIFQMTVGQSLIDGYMF